MTAVGASAAQILNDGLGVLGLSVVFCFIYHLLRLLLPLRRRVPSYIFHVVLFAAFGLLYFCFVLGRTASQQIRWHMAVASAAAVGVYVVTMAPLVDAAARRLRRAALALLRPVAAFFRSLYAKTILRFVAYLQKVYSLLYNTRKRRRTSRAPRKKRNENGGQKRKEPIKVHTQT